MSMFVEPVVRHQKSTTHKRRRIVNEIMNIKCNESKKLSLDVMENDCCSHIGLGIV